MGGVVAKLYDPGRVNPEPGWGERKKPEAAQKVVKMYGFKGLGDASDANDK